MRRINCESDFDFIWTLRDSGGSDIGFPTYDWEAEFKTFSRGAVVKASCIGGVMTNCYNDNDRIHVVLKGHGLEVGELKSKLKLLIPDDKYPDDERLEVVPDATGIELVREKGETPVLGDIESMIPIYNELKGEPFRYEDFTEAQLADLKKPATDAAQECLTAETKRVQAENARVQAENARVQEFANYQPLISAKRNDFVDSADIVLKSTTNGEESTVTALELTEMAKRSLFDDLWLKAVGVWGKIDHTHMENGNSAPYYLNELWLTYDEALAVYNFGAINGYDCRGVYRGHTNNNKNLTPRTNLPRRTATQYGYKSCGYMAQNMLTASFEVLNLEFIEGEDPNGFCLDNRESLWGEDASTFSDYNFNFPGNSLKKVIGVLDFRFWNSGNKHKYNHGWWGGAYVCEEIKVRNLNHSARFFYSMPKINAASIRYMIENANVPSEGIEPWVAQKTYENLQAGEGEWAGLLELAAEKGITFVKGS